VETRDKFNNFNMLSRRPWQCLAAHQCAAASGLGTADLCTSNYFFSENPFSKTSNASSFLHNNTLTSSALVFLQRKFISKTSPANSVCLHNNNATFFVTLFSNENSYGSCSNFTVNLAVLKMRGYSNINYELCNLFTDTAGTVRACDRSNFLWKKQL